MHAPSFQAEAPRLLEDIVHQAERAGASDIHPQMLGQTAQVQFRLDRVMTPPVSVAGEVAGRLFGRVKFLARLKTYQESLPQDGRIDRADLGSQSDLRVSTYPTVTGEKIVLLRQDPRCSCSARFATRKAPPSPCAPRSRGIW